MIMNTDPPAAAHTGRASQLSADDHRSGTYNRLSRRCRVQAADHDGWPEEVAFAAAQHAPASGEDHQLGTHNRAQCGCQAQSNDHERPPGQPPYAAADNPTSRQ